MAVNKEATMEIRGELWFSKKQRDVCDACGDRRKFGVLDNGNMVEYTEIKTGIYINNKCNWDDAICLGKGKYHHVGSK